MVVANQSDPQPYIALVAAMDRKRAIGRDNALPWHLPDDLKRFKALTLDRTLLMGRRTAESLGRALPRRRNLVLTQSRHTPFEGMQAVATVDEALSMLDPADTLYVIGGGAVYAHLLPIAQRMYLTMIDCVIDDADTFFPPFDAAQWQVSSRQSHLADTRHAHPFEFVDLIRALV